MSRVVILFLIVSAGATVFAQDKKSEVSELLEQSKKHEDIVRASCLQKRGKYPLIISEDGGRAMVLPTPRYPAIAKMGHAAGQVLVRILVDVNGSVIAAAAISGHPLLYGVSVATARNSKFIPTKVGEKCAQMTGVIAYNFILPRGS